MYHHLDLTRLVEPTALDEYPNVVAFMAAVEKVPGVCDYLAARGKCVGIGTKPMLDPVPAPIIDYKF